MRQLDQILASLQGQAPGAAAYRAAQLFAGGAISSPAGEEHWSSEAARSALRTIDLELTARVAPESVIDMGRGLSRASTEPPISMFQLDPARLDLYIGTPVKLERIGLRVMPRQVIPGPGFGFEWQKWDRPDFLRVREDLERPMLSEYKMGHFSVSKEAGTLRRFGFATAFDLDELANATPRLRLGQRAASFARFGVEQALEGVRRDLLVDPASYGSTLALTGADSWAGTTPAMLSDIQTMSTAIAAPWGLDAVDVTWCFPGVSFQAAINETNFRTWLTTVAESRGDAALDSKERQAEALRQYLGVKRVWTGTPMEANPDGTDSLVQMYLDSNGEGVAIGYLEAAFGPDYSTEWGEIGFGFSFSKTISGVANRPFVMEEKTGQVFPWTDYLEPIVVSPAAGALITGTNATP